MWTELACVNWRTCPALAGVVRSGKRRAGRGWDHRVFSFSGPTNVKRQPAQGTGDD